jgi:hypothetical protein
MVEEMKTHQMAEMPRYKCHKQVWALQIASVSHNTTTIWRRLAFVEKGHAPLVVDGSLFSRYTPEPGDYYVVYADGYDELGARWYVIFSPKKAFEEVWENV